jgi:carbonic anhydrase/acetyltransferase-like protein (isoleucine patch superfamily)
VLNAQLLVEFEGKRPSVSKGAFVAPTATLIGDVTVEAGASVWYGAVLRGDFGKIVIRAGSNIQDNAVVHTIRDFTTEVGPDATVGHGAVLHACRVGPGAVIGINAAVLNRALVGEQAMVAAGSAVPENGVVPARHLAAGAPAEVKKELSGSALDWVTRSAKVYQELAQHYLGRAPT